MSVSEASQVWENRERWQLWQTGSRAPSEGAATISFNESQLWVSVSPALSVAVTVAEAEIKCCSVSGNN